MQTFTGTQYLQIDIANNFGHDKLKWNERLAWFETHENQLESLVPQAKEPAMFYAGVKAYRDMQAGKPIGYMIGLDATASGMQILAALTGDRSAAELCNVVPFILDFSPEAEADRRDGYTVIYEIMLEALGENAKISRDDVKQAIMTSLYGSKAMPKKIFGEGALLDLFYQVMQFVAPVAWELNETMLALWDPTATAYQWTMPDNFHVVTKVISTVSERVHFDNQPFDVSYKVNQPQEEGRSLCANMTHSIDGMIVREMVRRCSYDPDKIAYLSTLIETSTTKGTSTLTPDDQLVQLLWDRYLETGYLSARILNHLDEHNFGLVSPMVISDLIASLPKKPFTVVPVHDCFRCHPNYGNDLRWQYTNQLKLIAASNLLSSLLSQITGRSIQIGKLDPTLQLDVMASDYALS